MPFSGRLIASLKAYGSGVARQFRGRATGPLAKRVATFGVVALVVSTAAISGVIPGVSPVQEVSAEWSDECDLADSLLGAAYNTLTGADTGCRWLAGEQTDYENQSATDGYVTALGIKDSTATYTTSLSNTVQNSRTIAYSKGKITLVNGLNNESSVSVVQAEINQSVDGYYSRMQMEMVQDYNNKMLQASYLIRSTPTQIYPEGNSAENHFVTWQNTTRTLANGTSVNVIGFELNQGSGDGTGYYVNWDKSNALAVEDPDTGSSTVFLDHTDYETIFNDLDQQAQQVKDNLAPYSEEVYNQYQAGEISSTDLAANDPSVIAAEAATSRKSTGYYSYAAIQLAAIGASGNVNVSHTITTGDGTELNGSLYYTADDMPEDGWKTGSTYNISNFNGTFYMAVQKETGNATVVDLANYGSNFTISEAKNTDTGNTVNTTKVQTYTYDSANASNLKEEINRLRELRESYENISVAGSGTGCIAACGDGSSILPKETGLVVVLGLVALILLARP